MREQHAEVELISLERNRGFAAAVNEGIRRAAGSYVALLNNDVVADPEWLAQLVACAERHPAAAAVAPKLLRWLEPDVIDSAGDIFTSWLRAYPRGAGERDLGQYGQEAEVFGVSGAASLWRTGVVKELGLFDDGFFFGYEDVDLCFRARLAGYECWYCPNAKALHRGGATSGGRPEYVYRHATRNRWAVIVKDVPAPLLARSALRLAAGEVLTLVRCARERQLRQLWRGYRDTFDSLSGWRRRRRHLQHERRVKAAVIGRALTRGHPDLLRRGTRVFRG
jgi:GT2 family glycosyltransferase